MVHLKSEVLVVIQIVWERLRVSSVTSIVRQPSVYFLVGSHNTWEGWKYVNMSQRRGQLPHLICGQAFRLGTEMVGWRDRGPASHSS